VGLFANSVQNEDPNRIAEMEMTGIWESVTSVSRRSNSALRLLPDYYHLGLHPSYFRYRCARLKAVRTIAYIDLARTTGKVKFRSIGCTEPWSVAAEVPRKGRACSVISIAGDLRFIAGRI
jgi:hypothetical protein